MQDADAILHVKTGELNADVLIADVIRKLNFRKFCTVTYIQILHEVLHYKNLVLYKKLKNSIMPKSFFSRKQHFRSLKIFGIIEFFKILHNVNLRCL